MVPLGACFAFDLSNIEMNFENRLFELLVDHFDLSKELTSIAFLTIAVLVILLVVWLSNFLVKRFVLNFIRSLPENIC